MCGEANVRIKCVYLHRTQPHFTHESTVFTLFATDPVGSTPPSDICTGGPGI